MQRPAHALIAFLLFATPLAAHAKQVTTWDFLGGKVPGQWQLSNLTPPELTRNGLHIATSTEGHMLRPTGLPHRIDMVEIETISPTETEALLLFRAKGDPEGSMRKFPFTIVKSAEPVTALLDVSSFANWDPQTELLGFAFPAGAEVMLRAARFTSFNPVDRAVEVLRGLATFDDFKPYTINFLWGPRLAFTPAERAAMFTRNPPLAPSVHWAMYALLIIVGALALAQVLRGRWTRKHGALVFLAVIAACWMAEDIRMGAEFLSYASDDWRTYWGRPQAERVFRVRRGFDAYAGQMAPLLTGEKEYVFAVSDENFVDYMRYATYPALPVRPADAGSGITLWAVFERPDALLTEDSRLVFGDGTVTAPGDVVAAFDLDSFLFRIRQ